MKILYLCLFLILIFPSCGLQAGIFGNNVEIELGGCGKMMTGHTAYTLNFSMNYYYSHVSGLAENTSELEFPLDIYLTGLDFSINGLVGNPSDWQSRFTYLFNANDPDNSMKDSDWVRIPDAGFDRLVVYSESAAEVKATHLEVCGRARFTKEGRFTIDGLLGFRYQNFKYDMFGVDGWYLDGDLNRISFSDNPGEIVLKYEIKYYIPYAGLASQIDVVHPVTADIRLLVSPLAMTDDFDNHVLRYKTAEGSTTGAMLSLEGRFDIPLKASNKLNCIFSLGYEYTTISTTGDETQRWYGDDPASPDFDDTGSIIRGLDHEIKSTQTALNAGVVVRF
jgi:hypothetical protein